MYVLKNIGPVRIGNSTHRFLIGNELNKIQIEHFKKSGEFEELFKAGVIGEKPKVKSDEPIRSGESGQPGNIDESGRVQSSDDGNESNGSKRGNKGKTG